MRRTTWILVILLALAVLGAPHTWAAGKGQGQGNGNGNRVGGAQQQAQWVNNQPPGWNGHGHKQGWQGGTTPTGLNKNFNNTGKYPKGLQKPR